MKLSTLSWLTAATLSLSVGVFAAQTNESSTDDASANATPQIPEAVVAQMSDTCVPLEEARLAPEHYTFDGEGDGEEGGELWLTPCNAGAYQASYEAIYKHANGAPRKLLFAKWQDDSWTGTELLFNPTFDPKTGVLSDQYRDRGAGGCGGERTWQWQEDNFRLTEYRAQETCQDEAGDYPVVFEIE